MVDGPPAVGDGPMFADGPTTSVDVVAAAPPSVLWPLITDIELPARFSAEFQGAHWLDGGTAALGGRFVGRNANERIGEWTVIDCRPERCFGWAVGDPDRAAASWSYELEPSPGGTLLRPWPARTRPECPARPHAVRGTRTGLRCTVEYVAVQP